MAYCPAPSLCASLRALGPLVAELHACDVLVRFTTVFESMERIQEQLDQIS